MGETSSRLLNLLSLLQARRDWPGASWPTGSRSPARTVRRDVERLRELGYPVDSLTGPGRRLPAARRRGDAAAAARRRGGDRDRGRPAHGGARVGRPASRRPRCARWSSSSRCCPPHLRRRVDALGVGNVASPSGGPTVDPQHLTVARRRLPRLRARALRLPRPRAARRPAARSSRTRSSTSGAAGTSSPGTARARTGARSGSTASRARPRPGVRFAAREPPARDAGRLRRPRASPAALHRYEAQVTVHAAGGRAARRASRRARGRSSRSTTSAASYRTGDYDLDWLALRIAMLDAELEVHEPPELVERLKRLAQRVGRAVG